VDSKSGTITKYSVAADGCMTMEGVVYTLNRENFPAGSILDGMTIDDQGNLWVVVSGGGCVLCVDPTSGLEVDRVEVPTSKPTACAFGTFQRFLP
jgi:sugar lactone lactonase YvrE